MERETQGLKIDIVDSFDDFTEPVTPESNEKEPNTNGEEKQEAVKGEEGNKPVEGNTNEDDSWIEIEKTEKNETDKELENSSDSPEGERNDDEGDEDDENVNYVNSFAQSLGFDVPEEKLKEYSNDWEGLTKLTKDFSETYTKNTMEQFFQEYPEINMLYSFLEKGGTMDEFVKTNTQPEYVTGEISEDDEATQKMIARHFLGDIKGLDKDDVDASISKLADEGKLYNRVKVYQQQIQEMKKQKLQQIEAEKIKERQRQQEEYMVLQKQIEQQIKQVPFIPEMKKNQFYKDLTTPIAENGMTLQQKKYEELPMDKRLLIDWLVYTNFKDVNITSQSNVDISSLGRKKRINSGSSPQNQTKIHSFKDLNKRLL